MLVLHFLDRVVRNLEVLDPAWVASLIFAALGLGFAIFALVRKRGQGGLLAMLMASLAAGSGAAGQILGQRSIEQALASRAMPRTIAGHLNRGETRAELERSRRVMFPSARALGRQGVLVAVLPLLLGALAALWRPAGSRALAAGFLGVAVLCWLGTLAIALRPPPVDRYDFAEDDEDAWVLAIALDRLHEPVPPAGWHVPGCGWLEQALEPFWGATTRLEWPRVMRRPIPPSLGVWRAEARTCVEANLARLKRTDTEVEDLRRSVLVQDEDLHREVEGLLPIPAGPDDEESVLSEALRNVLGVPDGGPDLRLH